MSRPRASSIACAEVDGEVGALAGEERLAGASEVVEDVVVGRDAGDVGRDRGVGQAPPFTVGFRGLVREYVEDRSSEAAAVEGVADAVQVDRRAATDVEKARLPA